MDDGSCLAPEFVCDGDNPTTANMMLAPYDHFILSADCTLSGEILLTGDLEIIGQTQDMNNLVTITAATGQRHFKLVATDAATTFTLRYLKLTGGSATEYCYNVDTGVNHCVGSGGGSGGGGSGGSTSMGSGSSSITRSILHPG